MVVYLAYPEFLRKQASSLEFRESEGRCLEIGIINNMPDAALEATERQFLELLAAAARDLVLRVTLYRLPSVGRSELGERHVATYSDLNDLLNRHLDGLIVTGAEPRAANLKDEPYWSNLTTVLEWADQNTHSSVWSCLAAHAAVLHLDGINRVALGDKRFGVFECRRLSDHNLTSGVPMRLQIPHSRWNDIPEDALTACGYRVLTRALSAGVDSFVKQAGSMFVFFQGHPEYEASTLLLEYRRDVGRYLRRERDTYPAMPQGYFNAAIIDALVAAREQAIVERREDQLTNFPTGLAIESVVNTWRSNAVRVYRNWLMYLSTAKKRRLKTGLRIKHVRRRPRARPLEGEPSTPTHENAADTGHPHQQ
jgi:homoserine O-succinyltransferase